MSTVTAKEIFSLRKHGQYKDAYDAARLLYATDKSQYASSTMFWAAVDMLKMKVREGRMYEAQKIFLALQRLSGVLVDERDRICDALDKCDMLIHGDNANHVSKNNDPKHLRLGVWGENLAAAFLRDKGYVILERNWHSGHRDIDIIAQDGEWIVFVEVKTRNNRNFADPLSAIDHNKQRNLLRAMNHYIKNHKLENPCRLDVITIVGTPDSGQPEIDHIEHCSISR